MINQNININSNIKNIKEKLKEKILFYFEAENEQDLNLKLEDIVNYYSNLFVLELTTNYNKISIINFFLEIINNYTKKWLVKTIVNSIIKIYNFNKKNDINLLIDNEYFLFKFLSNKEILKDFINKHINLLVINYDLLFIIFDNEKDIIFKNYKNSIDQIKFFKYTEKYLTDMKILLNIDRNSLLEEDAFLANSNYYNLYFNFRKNILYKCEDKIIDIINNKSFFVLNDKNEIDISIYFKNLFSVTLDFKVTDHILSIETNDYEILTEEFNKKINNNEIFSK